MPTDLKKGSIFIHREQFSEFSEKIPSVGIICEFVSSPTRSRTHIRQIPRYGALVDVYIQDLFPHWQIYTKFSGKLWAIDRIHNAYTVATSASVENN